MRDLASLQGALDVYCTAHEIATVETETVQPLNLDLARLSVGDVVLELARLRGGRLKVAEAAKILVQVGMYTHEKDASANLYSALRRHGQRFQKERPGVYVLVEARLPDATQPPLVLMEPPPMPLRSDVHERVMAAPA